MKLGEFMNLFAEFRASSWDGWREVLARISGSTREFYAVVGRGAGKSRMVALIACAFATREYERAPGEYVYVGVFGPTKAQAAITYRYIRGLFRSVSQLEGLIIGEKAHSLELSNHVVIEVITATVASPRGRAYALVILEEAAFLPQDRSVNPDVELLRAVRPALARVPGSLLCVVSSPYARRGIIWEAFKRHQNNEDGRVVYVQAPTLDLNPTFDRSAVDLALEEDPAGARAEYLAEFRRDIESYASREAIEACVIPARRELSRVADVRYLAFVDPSGGSADSFTLAIGHTEEKGNPVAVVDAIRERRPPFSPESVVEEFATVLKSFGVRKVTGDRYAGEWPREAFRRYGILYEPASMSKSDLYRDALALLNAGRVELLDDDRLVTQLVGLERRTARGGRDSIDHAPGQHDDLANVVAGLAVRLAVHRSRCTSWVWGRNTPKARSNQNGEMSKREIRKARLAFARDIERQRQGI